MSPSEPTLTVQDTTEGLLQPLMQHMLLQFAQHAFSGDQQPAQWHMESTQAESNQSAGFVHSAQVCANLGVAKVTDLEKGPAAMSIPV